MKFWRCYSYLQEYGEDKKVYLSRKKEHKKTETNSFRDMYQCQTCQVSFAVKLTVLRYDIKFSR